MPEAFTWEVWKTIIEDLNDLTENPPGPLCPPLSPLPLPEVGGIITKSDWLTKVQGRLGWVCPESEIIYSNKLDANYLADIRAAIVTGWCRDCNIQCCMLDNYYLKLGVNKFMIGTQSETYTRWIFNIVYEDAGYAFGTGGLVFDGLMVCGQVTYTSITNTYLTTLYDLGEYYSHPPDKGCEYGPNVCSFVRETDLESSKPGPSGVFPVAFGVAKNIIDIDWITGQGEWVGWECIPPCGPGGWDDCPCAKRVNETRHYDTTIHDLNITELLICPEEI